MSACFCAFLVYITSFPIFNIQLPPSLWLLFIFLLSSGFAMAGVQFSNVNNKFKCLMCGDEFENEGGITSHNKIHNRFYPYRCRRCHNVFKTKSHLENHERNNEHAINNQVPQ